MDKISLENYRCFRERQSARLAPLTLLVGENSTGKTSFMALIRALWDIAYRERIPDFREEPYDLGTFDEIAHYRGGRGGRAKDFAAGFTITTPKHPKKAVQHTRKFEVKFRKNGTMPIPVRRCITNVNDRKTWAEIVMNQSSHNFRFETSRDRSWKWKTPIDFYGKLDSRDDLPAFGNFLRRLRFFQTTEDTEKEAAVGPPFKEIDWRKGFDLLTPFHRVSDRRFFPRPYASAPVRSKPKRTYDPSRPTSDPQGDYIPMYFADMHFAHESNWNKLRSSLEEFGRQSDLFDEIWVKPLGKNEGGPFQLQIRKRGRKLIGPGRNLIDVGYGVSQVLPVITEILRPDAPSMFFLQQPEVHLHPSAQAALGSLLCRVAGGRRQLIIETHSDHLLDRVRMDIRDQQTKLRPQDVSILYFERSDLDVHIHSLGLDREGNLLGAPDSYRRFFLEETERSIWRRRFKGGQKNVRHR